MQTSGFYKALFTTHPGPAPPTDSEHVAPWAGAVDGFQARGTCAGAADGRGLEQLVTGL